MRSDPYRDFAEVYDDWQRIYPRPFSLALAPKIAATVRGRKAPVPILADLACGTGTFALWWHRTHPSWKVFGSDRSPAMIAAARMEARAVKGSGARAEARRQAPPEFFVQELKELTLPAPVGVITCLFDSLNHVTRISELGRIFRHVQASLAPKGLFIFDLVEELTFPEVFSGSSILEGDGLYLGMESEYFEAKGKGYGEARFTFFRRAGRIRAGQGRKAGTHTKEAWTRIEFKIRERRWSREEIRDLLSEAGLDLVRLERLDPYASKEFFVPRTFWISRRSR